MIKIFNLNVEGHRHLEEKILPFLAAKKPEVICFQEVFAADLPFLAEQGYQGRFQAMTQIKPDSFFQQPVSGGLGLFLGAKLPIEAGEFILYRGEPNSIPVAPKILGKNPKIANFFNRYLGWIRVKKAEELYTVATTHFTYDPQGQVNQAQRQDLAKLLTITSQLPPHLLTGDLNTPRGKELWSQLEEYYKDNVPADVETTIDNQLHRADHQLKLVVDAFFSQPPYRVKSLEVISGLSDHKGLLGQVAVKV